MTHPVANEVEVSTEQVEKYLLQWAKPGYSGQRKIFVRVLAEAGTKVVFVPTGNEVQRTKEPSQPISPRLFGDQNLPTERETMVRVGIAQNKHRFRLGMKLTAVVANFQDGRLMGFEWETVG